MVSHQQDPGFMSSRRLHWPSNLGIACKNIERQQTDLDSYPCGLRFSTLNKENGRGGGRELTTAGVADKNMQSVQHTDCLRYGGVL